jgi:hypothetical protein
VQPKAEADGRVGLDLVFGEPPRPVRLTQVRRALQWWRSIIKWFEPAFATDSEPEPTVGS